MITTKICTWIKIKGSNTDDEMEKMQKKDEYNTEYNQQERPKRESKVSWILFITTLSVSLGCSVPAGYNIGVVNAPSEILKQWCNDTILFRYAVELTKPQLDVLWSVLVSVFLIGGIIGGAAGGNLADKFGRKGALRLTYFLNLLSGISFLCCKPVALVELFFLARLIAGLSAGLTMAMVPMYLLEIAPMNTEGIFGVIFTVGLNFGVVLSQFLGLENLLGTEQLWPYLFSLFAGLVLVVLPVLPFVPESPKYLYTVCNNYRRALIELSHLRGKPESEISWELGKLVVSSEIWTLRKVLNDPINRKALLITCVIMLGQQLSGINAIFYYSTSIYINAGLSTVGAQYGNLGAGLINFIVTVLSTVFINNFGRKTLLIFSCIACVFMLTGLMTFMVLSSAGTITGLSFLSVFFIIGYVLFYGIGIGPIPFFIGSELVDVGPRPIIMAANSVANWSGNFLVGLTFPIISLALKEFSFLPFIGCTIFLIIFTWKCVPETRVTTEVETIEPK
ncbi:solute carrier family 2, facilitated glucose transporter member 1-like isoform X2 [Adelges cooleyi]|uniref:solute carrier family 2, facilitated glucose transporter member 1-like isoform X2 n=1 Tax=Adelges cooleyi TaxID=133065 RepID=UPI00217FA872|nr:solute carrier family 2, facilitated glucose transporter member 1-like isoform X2 [Adelges cooleyi]XP_050435368.1 solute carrier family 2, facilitated glucose transporter member 1-like isoform X2 [Adelges cooleyi]XP_050435378.1 solute carrier family 2, facilitated glucose transporter member 1-like isoform X2 [Adelges cooleyi]